MSDDTVRRYSKVLSNGPSSNQALLHQLISNKPLTRLHPGAGSFHFAGGSASLIAPISVRYYRPSEFSEDSPVLFVMHGTGRNAAKYRDNWSVSAEKHGFLLLCPEFATVSYSSKAYQLGGLVDDSGDWLPERTWTFGVIEDLFDLVREATGNTSEQYYLYGHSAGGQFVHRMVLSMRLTRCELAIAANTGWYTMPTYESKKFPYSLKHSGISEAKLKQAFSRRLVVLLGEEDTDSEDPTLRKTRSARSQGANRLERGYTFYDTAQDKATRYGVPLNWKLRTVPGANHHDPHIMPAATQVFFEE